MNALDASQRQAHTLEHRDHRPWPLPEGPWAQAQSWEELAFLHWRVDAASLLRLLPSTVDLDLYDGDAWLGIVPFRVTNLRLRGLPPLPGFSTFLELNVRTYVTHGGKPGVWFFSLDAGSRFFVEAAKRLYRLPYELARIECERHGEQVHYDSKRDGAAFHAHYGGNGALFRAQPGSLEAFLTERYCLYTADGGRLRRADIHHPPWDLQPATAAVLTNTMSPVDLPEEQEPHVLFCPRQDVVVWRLEDAR